MEEKRKTNTNIGRRCNKANETKVTRIAHFVREKEEDQRIKRISCRLQGYDHVKR